MQMDFRCICGEGCALPVLFLCHLGSSSGLVFPKVLSIILCNRVTRQPAFAYLFPAR